MKKVVFLLVLVMLLGGAVPAAAQDGSTGGDMLLSLFEGDDYGAAVAYNSNAQEFLAVWCHQGHIYGQRYTVQGVPQGENFVISNAPNGKYNPAVAYSLPTDSYLVVWEYLSGQDFDIYGQRLDADGALLDNPLTPEDESDPAVNFVIYEGEGDQRYADLAFDGSAYLVVWEDQPPDEVSDVAGRFVDDLGGDVGLTVYPLGVTGAASHSRPAVAYNETEGEYLVVFQYGADAEAEIHARRVTSAGVLPGGEYTIADQPDAAAPAVAAAGWGAYVVVWSDNRAGGQGNDIYGQVVLSGADSSFDGSNFAIASAAYSQLEPAIARSPSTGQFLVVWKDGRGDTSSGWDLYAQRLLADANLAGSNFILSAAPDDQAEPAIAASQSPDIYFVAWEDTRTQSRYDVYGQRVAWSGSLLWYEFAISAQPQAQSDVAIAYNAADDQYLVAWEDTREGYANIYVQRISGGGQVQEEAWPIAFDDERKNPTVAYNSQHHFYLLVWEVPDLNILGWCQVYPAGDGQVCAYYPRTENGRLPRLVYNESDDSFLLAWEANGDIYVMALDWYGFPPGDPTPVADGTGQEENPALTFDEEHQRYLVVWDDDQSGAERIYGRFIHPDGTVYGAAFPVTDDTDGLPRQRPALAYNPNADEYLVVYERTLAGGTDICGEQVSYLGGYDPNEIVIRDQPANVDRYTPAVAYIPAANRYYVLWSEYQDSTYGQDLYCRWLEGDGSMATASLPFFRYPSDQEQARLAYAPNHTEGLIVWLDKRYNKGGDIYGRVGAVDVTPPTALFTRDPTTAPAGTAFTFDAAPSYDDATPAGALAVRWDFTSDGSWDTAWSYDKVVTKTVNVPNTYTITLEVQDLMGLTDTLSLPITALAPAANTPPTATLTISPVVGLAGSTFRLDASASSDAETPAANLQVRWDWQNDGVFDTQWSGLKVRTPTYTEAGLHTARVEVRDAEGLTDAAVRAFVVLPGEAVTLTIQPASTVLEAGAAVQFRAVAWDTYGNEMGNPNVVWSVTDAQAGTISADGVFTASTQIGTYTAVIRAESGSASDTASITIIYPYHLYLPLVLRGN